MALKLITSAAYVDPELAAEFGRLPPAFLPVGHGRLYEAQIAALAQIDGRTIITIPESFSVPSVDMQSLDARGVEVLPVPDDMRLGEAILYAIELLAPIDEPIHVLHGDTLTRAALPDQTDVIAVVQRPDTYDWGVLSKQNKTLLENKLIVSDILAGYFCFDSELELRRSLAKSRGDFVEAVRLYDVAQPLTKLHISDWLDFGHLQTYYRSRCSIQTQRSFNDLNLTFQVVRKSGNQTEKIAAEAQWFEDLPRKLRLYTPAFLGQKTGVSGQLEYNLEYLPFPTLHELFVFGDIGKETWEHILKSIHSFISECRSEPEKVPDEARNSLTRLVPEKTTDRLKQFQEKSGISVDDEWRFENRPLPSLRRIADACTQIIDFNDDRFLGIMHGDLCFTNTFYDFRTQRVRVIDPRGTVDNVHPSIWGDNRYDLAKLCHSIVGGYDLILASRFECSGLSERNISLEFAPSSSANILSQLVEEIDFLGVKLDSPEILAICTHLFLAMVPLHADRPDRQRAFVANALRLFAILEEKV